MEKKSAQISRHGNQCTMLKMIISKAIDLQSFGIPSNWLFISFMCVHIVIFALVNLRDGNMQIVILKPLNIGTLPSFINERANLIFFFVIFRCNAQTQYIISFKLDVLVTCETLQQFKNK